MRYSRLGYWGPQAGAIALMGVMAGLVFWLMPSGPSLGKAVIFSLLSAAAIAVALSAYRSADEVILATHKTAWFWGSMTALLLIAPLSILVNMEVFPLSALLPGTRLPPSVYFSFGIVVLLLLQCLGFLAVWSYHNFGRRR